MRSLYPVVVVSSLLGVSASAAAQGVILPWGQSSDMVGWEMFAQITAPSGQPNKVEFETWATDEDIYTKDPAQWPTVNQPKSLRVSALAHARVRPGAAASWKMPWNWSKRKSGGGVVMLVMIVLRP